jgi:hypothetical protein
MIWKSSLSLVFLLFCVAQSQRETADDSAYAKEKVPRTQLRWIIDTPTAGMLPRGAFDVDMRTFAGGGLQTALGIGLMDRFSIALGYGASYVLTDTIPDWNPKLEFELRYRLLDESRTLPAIAVGYSSQGFGKYDKDNKRYQVKSPGFYLAFSKNFTIYSNTSAGWHWGANYSLENKNDNDPSVFIGFDTELGSSMDYLLEYDFALNDNKRYSIYGLGRGFLNMGLAWYLTDGLSLELDLKNLFRNRKDAHAIDREVRLVYVEFFY